MSTYRFLRLLRMAIVLYQALPISSSPRMPRLSTGYSELHVELGDGSYFRIIVQKVFDAHPH